MLLDSYTHLRWCVFACVPYRCEVQRVLPLVDSGHTTTATATTTTILWRLYGATRVRLYQNYYYNHFTALCT